MADRLLAASPRPTAVFMPADSVTAALYRAFAERRVRIGRDLSVISCNNELPLLSGLFPAPTTIDIHAAEIGRLAAERLAARILRPSAPSVDIRLRPSLVEGASVSPVK